MSRAPLSGIRVVELGMMVAAPFAGRVLADLGADVIKVEMPGYGDPLREWKDMHRGTSLWWRVQSRNKRLVTADLHLPEGRALVRRLILTADVLLENFRAGTLEKWGLDPEGLRAERPELVIVRISGFGQTGPYRTRTGLGSVAEAMGGVRYVTGHPDQPPSRVGMSLADQVAALFAVIATLAALLRRSRLGRGDVADIALYEAVFALMEAAVTEYAYSGEIRERAGGGFPGVAPSNTYPTADGRFIVIGANSDELFRRLMQAMGRVDLGDNPRYRTNPDRAADSATLDIAIGAWTSTQTLAECLAACERAEVPAGPIYSMADIVRDPQYAARDMLLDCSLEDGTSVVVPGIVPKFLEASGKIRWLGAERVGAHNHEVYSEVLGLAEDEIAALESNGTI